MSDEFEEKRPLISPSIGSINDSLRATPQLDPAFVKPKSLKDRILTFVSPTNLRLFVLLILMVLFGTADTVLFKMFTNKVVNYLYFFHQVFLGVFVVVFFPIAYVRKHWFKLVTPEMCALPKWKLCVIGGLDLLCTLLMMFGGAHTAGSLQTLLRQIPIVFTMAVSYVMLKVRYHWAHYVGALAIIAGIAMTVIVEMVSGGESSRALWAVCFALAGVPIAFSTVYKEIVMKEVQLDIYYMNAWVSLFQFLFGILLWPVAMPLQELPFNQTLVNIQQACMCWFGGINSLPGDDCDSHLWIVGVYILISICYNIFILLVVFSGSAALLWVATAMTVPVSNVLFMMPFIMGVAVVAFDWWTIGGMILVLVGLVFFNKAPEPHSADAPVVEEHHDAHTV